MKQGGFDKDIVNELGGYRNQEGSHDERNYQGKTSLVFHKPTRRGSTIALNPAGLSPP